MALNEQQTKLREENSTAEVKHDNAPVETAMIDVKEIADLATLTDKPGGHSSLNVMCGFCLWSSNLIHFFWSRVQAGDTYQQRTDSEFRRDTQSRTKQ